VGFFLSQKKLIMTLPVKVVLDGTLFSECELRGANRDGMMRLTEDITEELVLNSELDISFASNYYVEKYDSALKRFISEHYPRNSSKLFSKNPPLITNVLKWKEMFKNSLSGLSTSYYDEINNQDIFHSFYYPFQKNVYKNRIRKSITFLDIIPLKLNGYPESLIQKTKAIVECIVSGYAISISSFSREDLINFDKRINPENVFVAPLAASQKLFYKNTDRHDWEIVKEKYALPDHYFLSVSGNDKRKNIRHLIKSFNKFIMQEKPGDIHLVLTGNGSHNRSMLDDMNINKEVRDKIFIPDTFVDSNDLAVLYSNSISFFFMSLYEGFGLPALEAMQCGVPVVASSTTSLPEVVGDAGILLSPTNEDDLCQVMNNLYSDSSLRERYGNLGLKRAKTFSWKRCAEEYAAIFKQIASNPR
jgi:glycosyltransferase involved in cell wall biosynthesis